MEKRLAWLNDRDMCLLARSKQTDGVVEHKEYAIGMYRRDMYVHARGQRKRA